MDAEISLPTSAASGRHPRGLSTLFLTEMWERFSYYGMRSLLVLFMTATIPDGGLGLTDKIAAPIYGLFTAGVYLAGLPGGWVSDHFLGPRRSVWYGGIVLVFGHLLLAMPFRNSFFLGLILIVLGTGLLKPNVTTMVAGLYAEGGGRRDAGFTIFYLGINIGAALGPLVCGTLAHEMNWKIGFSAPGVAMVLGLVQFRLSVSKLGDVGQFQDDKTGARRKPSLLAGVVSGVALLIVCAALLSGRIHVDPTATSLVVTYAIVGVAILYFAYVLLFLRLNKPEKHRVGVIAILFAASAIFWAGFEEAGSALNLFAQRYTQRNLWGFTMPSEWFQSLGAVFVLCLSPVFAAAWVELGRRNLNPPLGVKFGIGLVMLGAGFLTMAQAAALVVRGEKAGPGWLFSTYLLHSLGELCLSPVGLSFVTKLAPRRLLGQLMGTWFLATSLGNIIAGLVAGTFTATAIERMPWQYLQLTLSFSGTGILLVLLAGPIQKLMAGIE